MEPKRKKEAQDLARTALEEIPLEIRRNMSGMAENLLLGVLVRVEELKMELEDLKKTNQRRMELTRYIETLTEIPETCGRYMHEMNDAVSELHELMGFKKHNKG